MALAVLVVIVASVAATALLHGSSGPSSAAATDPTSSTSSTSSTTMPTSTTSPGAATLVAATPGWGVIARTPRGVAVDQRWITVPGGARIWVLRFRKGTVAFHFHVGSEDPPGANASVPVDARSAISASEWRVGVLGVFNGGFKATANAGGTAVDGLVAVPLRRGAPTLVIDTQGQLTLGTWGGGVPVKGHPVVAARQNLAYLIANGAISPSVSDLAAWGSTLHNANAVARTGVGVNQAGDVMYAVGTPLLPIDLARALVAAGAVRAMELDINPYWPIAGASRTALHTASVFGFANPYSQHSPTIYETGWLRDFFVVAAEPGSARCGIRSPAPVVHQVAPEPLSIACGQHR